MGEPVELLQFRLSHYNEKARWALDWKRVPHQRTTLLPGPHAPRIQLLTGQSQLPVVRFHDATVHGSARIVAELDRRHPDPPLLPEDPALAARAQEVEALFDAEIGPLVRRALFAELLGELGYVCRLFAAEHPALLRALYRPGLPIVSRIMKRSMGITDAASVEAAVEGTRRGLDFVAKHAGPGGALVGDRFTTADLAAASLLAPAVSPPGSPMELPRPRPAGVERWLARWTDHPGAAWVRDQYARHRPASAAL